MKSRLIFINIGKKKRRTQQEEEEDETAIGEHFKTNYETCRNFAFFLRVERGTRVQHLEISKTYRTNEYYYLLARVGFDTARSRDRAFRSCLNVRGSYMALSGGIISASAAAAALFRTFGVPTATLRSRVPPAMVAKVQAGTITCAFVRASTISKAFATHECVF